MSKSINVKIVPAREEDADAVFSFLSESFFLDEPMNSVLKRAPNRDGWGPLEYLRSGYSYIAYATGDDGQSDIIGVVLNKVSVKENENKKMPTDPAGMKIFHILRKLDMKADIWSKVESDEVFYTVILSVGGKHRGLNVGRRLMEESLKKATSSGLSYAVVECTSYYSSKIVEKLGYERLCEIRYEDHRDEKGEVIFKIDKPHEGVVKYLKKLSAFELDVEKLDDDNSSATAAAAVSEGGGEGSVHRGHGDRARRGFIFRRYPPGDHRKRDLYQSA